MPRRRNADRTLKKKEAPAPAPEPEPEPEPRARRRDPQPVDESTEVVSADAKLNDSLAASDAAAGADAQSPMVFTDHVADRECQDSLCCIVLLAYVAALALIGMVAEEQGDLNRLLHPMDYKGWTCGTSENWDASGEWTEDGEPGWASTVDSRPYGYYPRLAEDVMYFAGGDGGNECMSSMGDNGGVPGSECKLNLYTICVESCPQAGDIVCTYEKERQLELLPTAQERTTARQVLATEREHCWWVPVDMSKYADRCIAFPPHVETTTTTYCDTFDEHGETIRAVIQPSEHTQCAGDIRTETNTVTETTGGSQTEFAALLVLSETMNMVTDVATCWPVILMIGGLVSVLASFSLLWLLRILAKPLVWLVIILLWFVLLVAMMIAFVKNGDFFGIDVSADAISNAMEERLDVGLSDSQAELMSGYLNEDESSILWLPLSYGLLVMCVAYILVLMASKKKVDLAIGLISVASKVVLTMPALAIYPFITWGLLFVALVYGLTVGALIDSADMRPADLGSAMTRMHHEVGCQFRPDAAARLECLEEHARNLSHVRCWNCSIDGTAPPLEYTADGSSDDWEVDAVMAFHFFGIIWIVHFIKDFCTIAMANVSPEPSRQSPSCCLTLDNVCSQAAAQGYWAEDLDGDGVIDIDPHAVLEGFKRTLHYSSGSAALGSFILAIVTCIRAICAYLSKQAQALDETSTTMKYVVKLVNCALWCFEKVIRFMTRAAYIIVAIEGKSFCGAAWRSFKMVL